MIIIADHGHTPVLKDNEHALGSAESPGPSKVIESVGFRPRKFVLKPGKDEQDYQSVVAYHGAISYL